MLEVLYLYLIDFSANSHLKTTIMTTAKAYTVSSRFDYL